MKQLKKTILTLALLIAATTQAWAEDKLYLVIDDGGTTATICYGDPGDYPYYENDGWNQNGSKWDEHNNIRPLIETVTIDESCQTFNGKSLSGLFAGFSSLTSINCLDNLRTDDVEDMSFMFESCSYLTTLDLSSFNTANVTYMSTMFVNCSILAKLDLSSFNTANVKYMNTMFMGCKKLETIYVGNGWSTTNVEVSPGMFDGCSKLPGYANAPYKDARMAKLTTAGGFLTYKALPTPVATPATDATNTALSLTQPAGNVTVSVKYYQQARFTNGGAPAAITGVQASTDNPIVTPGTVKTIGSSSVKMGTVKYHVSTTALTDADLLALGTDKWSSDVPKATNLGTGDAYVYYYIQGAEPASVAERSDANTCSDSDIKAANFVKVTLIAPPTYDVSLNKTGLATGEPAKWKAKSETVTTEVNLGTNDLEGVTKGETVTVTYSGTRKVIGVKAEKKASSPFANVTASDIGKVIGADGCIYADKTAAEAANTTAVAMITYVGSETGEVAPYNHGLALALSNAFGVSSLCKWKTSETDAGHTKQTDSSNFTIESGLQYNDATHNSDDYPAFKAAMANNGTAVPTGCSAWFLPTAYQWNQMINACKNVLGTNNNYKDLNDGFSSVGGKNLDSDCYWSSTENTDSYAWFYYFYDGIWYNDVKGNEFCVRSALAF